MAPAFTLTLTPGENDDYAHDKILWTLTGIEGLSPMHPIHQPLSRMFYITDFAWASQWAKTQIEESTPYTVTEWKEAGRDTWDAELKRIRHDFRVAWTDDEVATVYAKNADDAAQVRERVLRGDRFVELILGGDPVLINLAHVGTLIYRPTEVDL